MVVGSRMFCKILKPLNKLYGKAVLPFLVAVQGANIRERIP